MQHTSAYILHIQYIHVYMYLHVYHLHTMRPQDKEQHARIIFVRDSIIDNHNIPVSYAHVSEAFLAIPTRKKPWRQG